MGSYYLIFTELLPVALRRVLTAVWHCECSQHHQMYTES